jgi:hypothetical protein
MLRFESSRGAVFVWRQSEWTVPATGSARPVRRFEVRGRGGKAWPMPVRRQGATTTVNLAIADALQAHAADGIGLTQAHALALADALHAHTADAVVLSLEGYLGIADALQAHTAGSIALTQVHTLVVSDALHQHLADALSIFIPGLTVPDSDRVLVIRAAGRTLVVKRADRTLTVH